MTWNRNSFIGDDLEFNKYADKLRKKIIEELGVPPLLPGGTITFNKPPAKGSIVKITYTGEIITVSKLLKIILKVQYSNKKSDNRQLLKEILKIQDRRKKRNMKYTRSIKEEKE